MADVAALFRLGRAGFVLARAGIFSLADLEALPPGPRSVARFAAMLGPRNLTDTARAERRHNLVHADPPPHPRL